MSRTFKLICAFLSAAALLALAVFSALDRAETARAERLDWSDLRAIGSARGYGAAAAELEKKLSAHPNDALLHYYRARLYFEAGQGKEALAEADKAIALGYAQEISHLLKALIYGRLLGDSRQQLVLASKALAYDPTYDDGYLVRAEANYALRRYSECSADAASFTRMQPKETDGLELEFLCREAIGDHDAAEAAGLRLLKLKPDSHAALWRLGRLSAARGRHALAHKKFSEAIRLSGGRSQYFLDRASACEALGDFSCSAWDYAAALEWPELSGYASYYHLLGSAMHRAGELEEGLEAAEAAVSKAPAWGEGYELRARLKAEAGDLAGARRDLRAARALSPGLGRELSPLLTPAEPAGKRK